MTGLGRAAAVAAALVCLLCGSARAGSVSVSSVTVDFVEPGGWRADGLAPEGLLALYRPPGPERFPHLAVTEGVPGDGPSTLTRVRKSLAKLFGEVGIENPRPIQSPKLFSARGQQRVDFAYSGSLGGRSLEWYQTIVPDERASFVFTFAFPQGSLDRWRPQLDRFLASLRIRPRD